MARKVLIENGTADTTGSAVSSYGKRDTTFAFVGTFDGASCSIELSPDGTNWGTMGDALGVPVLITTETMDVHAQIVPQEYIVRGVITGGGGSTDITILMFD